MKEVILIKMGEIALKGLNRGSFEDILVKNIRWRLRPFGKFEIQLVAVLPLRWRPLSEMWTWTRSARRSARYSALQRIPVRL